MWVMSASVGVSNSLGMIQGRSQLRVVALAQTTGADQFGSVADTESNQFALFDANDIN